jgi:hypothetical protein
MTLTPASITGIARAAPVPPPAASGGQDGLRPMRSSIASCAFSTDRWAESMKPETCGSRRNYEGPPRWI